jgi:iron complex outermembrane receptor protein
VRLRSLAIVAVLAAPVVASAHPPPSPPAPTPSTACGFAIDVHTIDADSHEALPFVAVYVDGVYVGETDEHGHVIAGGQCAGARQIKAERGDYLVGERTVEVSRSRSLELELTVIPAEVVEIEDEAPAPVALGAATTLRGAALDRTRGRGLSEALAAVPGVTQLRSGTAMAKPIVRGQFGRRLLLLVDGLRHRAQEWGLDHAPEIDPFTADAITVVRGAAGVAYGPDAIGGAVVVEPPALRRTPGWGGDGFLVGTGNGAGGGGGARLQWVPEAAPAWSVQLEGSGQRTAAAWAPDYPIDNTGSRQWAAGATIGYRRGDASYRVGYRRYDAELGVCSCLRLESSEDLRALLTRDRPIGVEAYQADFAIERPSQAVVHDTVTARAEWPVADGLLTAHYGFQHDRRREFDVVRSAVTAAQFDFRLFTHDLAVTYAHRLLHLSDHLHLRGSVGAVGMFADHAYGGLPLVPAYDGAGVGAFVIERLLGRDFELEAGVRYDHLTRTAPIERDDYLRLVRSGQLAMDACPLGTETASCRSRFHALSATLGGLRQLTSALALKLELATAARVPTTDEQYLNGTAPSFPVLGLGKPDLGVETTYGATATATYQGERLAAEVSGFANYIADYIAFGPAIDADGQPIVDVLIRGTFPRFVTGAVDALYWGGDAGVTARPWPWLELAGQVAMVRARDRTHDRYLPLVPADRLHGAIALTRAEFGGLRDVRLELDATAVARQDRVDPLADLAPPPAGYVVVGGELAATLPTSREPIRLALSGANLTSTRHREYTSLNRYFVDQPGWQLSLRLTAHFDSPTSAR